MSKKEAKTILDNITNKLNWTPDELEEIRDVMIEAGILSPKNKQPQDKNVSIGKEKK